MTEIFEFGRSAGPLDAEDRYGRTGDMKKTKYVLQMIGKAGDPDTIKCLIAAAESGMEMDCRDISTIDGGYESDAIKKLDGWKVYSLVEDLEMQALCVSKGLRVIWWPEAITYDETTSTMAQASNQRLRWARGAFEVFFKYFNRLLIGGVKTLGRTPRCQSCRALRKGFPDRSG